MGLYILDNQGRYIYTNDAYDRLLDLPREKLIMRSVHELMHDGHYDACISDIVFREKQPVSVFLNVFVDDGNTIKREMCIRDRYWPHCAQIPTLQKA